MTPFAALEFTVAFDNAVVIAHGLSSGGSKKIAVVFFFICYLAAPGSALGHIEGPISFNHDAKNCVLSYSTQKSPGASKRGWVPTPGRAPSGI